MHTGRGDIEGRRLPEFVVESWLRLYAPKGLPQGILEKLREAVAVALEHPLVRTRFPETAAPFLRERTEVASECSSSGTSSAGARS